MRVRKDSEIKFQRLFHLTVRNDVQKSYEKLFEKFAKNKIEYAKKNLESGETLKIKRTRLGNFRTLFINDIEVLKMLGVKSGKKLKVNFYTLD